MPVCLGKITPSANASANATVSPFTLGRCSSPGAEPKMAHRGQHALSVTANTFPIKQQKQKVEKLSELSQKNL